MLHKETHRCRICAEGITAAQAIHGGGHCGSLACMTRATIAHRAERKRAREAEWNAQIAEVRTRTGIHVAGAVPHQNRPLAAPPPERIAAFEGALDAAIAAAFDDDAVLPDLATEDSPASPDSAPSPLVNTGCGACQGACCFQGGDTHAFIGPRLIARVRLDRLDATPEEIRALYTDAMPDRSTQDACLFQGETGCTLDRSIRSAICNGFECWHLKTIIRLGIDNPGAPVAVGAFDGPLQKLAIGRAASVPHRHPVMLDEDDLYTPTWPEGIQPPD